MSVTRVPQVLLKSRSHPPNSGCHYDGMNVVPYRGPTIEECHVKTTRIWRILFDAYEMMLVIVCKGRKLQ
jgi:hypothetical protein